MDRSLTPFRSPARRATDVLARLTVLLLLVAPAAAQDAATLAGQLSSADTRQRRSAARALATLGAAAKPAEAALLKALGDDDGWVLGDALKALAATRPGPAAVAPLLAALARHGVRHRVGPGVLAVLAAMGPDAAAAVPALRRRLPKAHLGMRHGLIDALIAIGPASAPALPEVLAATFVKPARVAALVRRVGAPAAGPLVDALAGVDPKTGGVFIWGTVERALAGLEVLRAAGQLPAERLAPAVARILQLRGAFHGRKYRGQLDALLALTPPSAIAGLLGSARPADVDAGLTLAARRGATAREALPALAALLEKTTDPERLARVARAMRAVDPAGSAPLLARRWLSRLEGGGRPVAAPLLWSVRKGGTRVGQLLGTVHMGVGVSDLPDVAREALAGCTTLVVESDPTKAQQLLRRGLSGGGLRQQLGDAWPQVTARLKQVPAQALERMAPWLAYLLLAVPPDPPTPSLDPQLVQAARTLGARVRYLETPGAIAKRMTALPEQTMLDGIRRMLEVTPAQIRRELELLIAIYRSGDADAMARRIATERASPGDGPLLRSLLDGRTRDWLPAVERALQAGGRPLIAVGSAHLVGEGSLIALLEGRGYRVARELGGARAPRYAGPLTALPRDAGGGSAAAGGEGTAEDGGGGLLWVVVVVVLIAVGGGVGAVVLRQRRAGAALVLLALALAGPARAEDLDARRGTGEAVTRAAVHPPSGV